MANPEPSVATVHGWVHVLPRQPFQIPAGVFVMWSGDPCAVVMSIDDGPVKAYPVAFERGKRGD